MWAKTGSPGRGRTVNLLSQSQALRQLSYRATGAWGKWCGVLVMLQAGQAGAWVTAKLASLTIYHRMENWLRSPELHRDDVAYETSPEAALPRDKKMNEHRCHLFRGRTRRLFSADVSVFAGTPPERPSRGLVKRAVPDDIRAGYASSSLGHDRRVPSSMRVDLK